ncbi:hypothetical protein JT26_00020 [Porphyromonas sp. COT-108 OH1349]|uniref:Secreted protein n=1 Tax=Porphyromonas canoris TaxID=36875 RepID=A0ABR4XJE6_9PORP|nr:hypothetical protein JT26_00020 [Porphyromonas sp. COT-108 OH1349]KGN91812.1 hypothetical protein HQ43_06955 [Porphyromonas canoris]
MGLFICPFCYLFCVAGFAFRPCRGNARKGDFGSCCFVNAVLFIVFGSRDSAGERNYRGDAASGSAGMGIKKDLHTLRVQVFSFIGIERSIVER